LSTLLTPQPELKKPPLRALQDPEEDPSTWEAYTSPDGRQYYYNTVRKGLLLVKDRGTPTHPSTRLPAQPSANP